MRGVRRRRGRRRIVFCGGAAPYRTAGVATVRRATGCAAVPRRGGERERQRPAPSRPPRGSEKPATARSRPAACVLCPVRRGAPGGGGAPRARRRRGGRETTNEPERTTVTHAVTHDRHDETHEETKTSASAPEKPQSAAAGPAEPTAFDDEKPSPRAPFAVSSPRRRAGRTWCARSACPLFAPEPAPGSGASGPAR